MSKTSARLCLPVLSLLILTACSDADQTPPVSVAGSAAEASPSMESLEPSIENTAVPEKPQEARRGNPGLSIASLPIGEGGEFSAESGDHLCVSPSWTGQDAAALTAGIAVKVTSVDIPDEYRKAGTCAGDPCFGYTFTESSGPCSVSLRSKDKSKTTRSYDVTGAVTLKGRALCTDPGGSTCLAFVKQAELIKQSLTIPLPVKPEAPPVTSTGSSGTNSAETTSPPETSGSTSGP
jgi:hypothetical protein